MTSEGKRLNVKNDYNLIAKQYAAEFGRTIEDEELVNDFLNKIGEQKQILDLGGGTGKLSNLINNNGCNSICFDFSEELVKIGKQLFPNVTFVLGDIVELNKYFSDNTFDGVIAFYSLFHIPEEDFNNVLIQIKNVMKNGGLFAFVVQLGKGESMVDEPYLMEKGKKSLYMNYFVKENLLENLKNIGFDVIYYDIKREIGENELGDIGNDKLLVLAKINK